MQGWPASDQLAVPRGFPHLVFGFGGLLYQLPELGATVCFLTSSLQRTQPGNSRDHASSPAGPRACVSLGAPPSRATRGPAFSRLCGPGCSGRLLALCAVGSGPRQTSIHPPQPGPQTPTPGSASLAQARVRQGALGGTSGRPAPPALLQTHAVRSSTPLPGPRTGMRRDRHEGDVGGNTVFWAGHQQGCPRTVGGRVLGPASPLPRRCCSLSRRTAAPGPAPLLPVFPPALGLRVLWRRNACPRPRLSRNSGLCVFPRP